MSAQIVNFRPSGDQSWAQWAACAEDGAAPMFPHEQDAAGTQAAKGICATCSVRAECLSEALERGEQFGVWGGMTADERRSLRRQTSRKAAKAKARLTTPAPVRKAPVKPLTAQVSADGKRLVGVPVTELDTKGLT